MADRTWTLGPRFRAAGLLTGASVASAAVGWGTLLIVGRAGGANAYTAFAVLWGVYYGLAGAFAGLQHEVTRTGAEGGATGHVRPSRLVGAVGVCGVVVAAAAVASVAVWGPAIDAGWGVAGFLFFAVLGLAGLVGTLGQLAALDKWRPMAALLFADAVTRLIAVSLVALTSGSLSSYMAAIAVGAWVWLPYVATTRGSVRPMTSSSETGFREFWSRAVPAMTATGCASLLVAGFPWLVATTTREPLTGSSAGLLAALVLFRSPVLVLMNGVRPLILRSMLARPEELGRSIRRARVLIMPVGSLLGVAAYLVGPWLLTTCFGRDFVVSRWQAAAFVASSTLLVMLTFSTLGLLAARLSWRATASWLVGVGGTIVVLLLPLGQDDALVWAAVAGPLAALATESLLRRGRGGAIIAGALPEDVAPEV